MKNESFNVGIVGCGAIGKKRAAALGPAELVICADIALDRAEAIAKVNSGITATKSWQMVIEREDVDIVIVSTTHNLLSEITIAALKSGKHVLVEKPAAINTKEIIPMIEAMETTGKKVRVGFNHRYHPAFIKVRELFADGGLSEIMYIRGRYGQGGHIGYESEWRANPKLSGGGEIIDQGVHLIDLARCLLGDFNDIHGFAKTYFWDMPVEDNGFIILKTPKEQTAFLHVSCTEWKNLFSFEIYCRNEKLHIDGLGRSYGVERLAYYKMLPEMGPPETKIWEYPMADNSWGVEFLEFIEDIKLDRPPVASLFDAYEALKIVEKIYKQSGIDYSI